MSKQQQEIQRGLVVNDVTLTPVLPSHNPRYTGPVDRDPGFRTSTVIPRFVKIPSLSTGALPLPEGWTEHVTPEGQAYFYHSGWNIVTTADIRIPEIAGHLAHGYGKLVEALANRGGLLNAEVYFNLGQGGALDYYLIDRTNLHPFWICDVNSGDLGLTPYESPGFLKSALLSEYWTHVDYFPNHQQLNEKTEMALINTLRFYVVDDMTSPGSTSPYGAKECMQYIKLLEGFKASGEVSENRIATIARLWASVARVRHINAYGLKFPRLDRLQGLSQYSFSQSRTSFKLSLGELLSFNRSRRTFQQLTALWNGRVVYQRHWQWFFAEMIAEWTRMGALSTAVFLADAILLASGKTTTPYMVSAALAGSAVVSAIFLHQVHSGERLATAPDISAYIVKVEDVSHGLRPLSLTFALPHALATYAAMFLAIGFIMQGLQSAVSSTDLLFITGVWCLPFSIILFLANMF